MFRLLPILLLLGAACGPAPITDIPNKAGGNPLVPEVAMFPFPSDFYLAEADTRTGRAIQIPQEALPADLLSQTFASADGWPRATAMLAFFGGGIDPGSLPDPTRVEATTLDDSPVFVVREGSWAKLPVLAELDATAAHLGEQSLILRPHMAMEPDTAYVVILKDKLQKADGSGPLEAGKAFRALRDGIPTDNEAVEAQRGDFELVNEAIAALGLDPASVVLAWSFHTRSREQVVTPMLSMTEQMMAAPLPDLVIDSDVVIGDSRQVRGHISAPNFIGPDSVIVTDANDEAEQQGSADVDFLLTIPDTVDRTRPTVLFGHGFFSNLDEPLEGTFHDLLVEYQLPALSINFLGFNTASLAPTIALLADFNHTDQISAQQMQSESLFVVMARLIREQLAGQITEDRGAGEFAVLDSNEVVYMGTSNGGTQGLTIMSTAPNLERGVLVVPGGAVVHMLQRASQWLTMGQAIASRFEDARELQLGSALMQLNLDPWDSINFIDHLVGQRFEGRDPVRVVLHEAVEDAQVNNMITHLVARSAGVPVFSPNTIEPWGIDTIPKAEYGGSAALYIYDEGYAPLPIDNTPPEENGAHGAVRDLDIYKQHVAAFIEDGTMAYFCVGACDPD